MPVDADVIRRLLAVVRKNHGIVAHYRDIPRPELSAEPGRMLAIQHGLQLAIQALVDLALHIRSATGAGPVERYRDAIAALEREGFLTAGAAETLRAMVGLRNLLVHGYAELDEGRLLELVDSRLDDLTAIADEIEGELRGRGVL